MGRYLWRSALIWGKSYPVLSRASKAVLLSWPRFANLHQCFSTAICEVYPDEISTHVEVRVLSLYLAACLADVNSKLELVIDAVDCRKCEGKGCGVVGDRRPRLHEDDRRAGHFGPAHFLHVFQVVFADTKDFGEGLERVQLIGHIIFVRMRA